MNKKNLEMRDFINNNNNNKQFLIGSPRKNYSSKQIHVYKSNTKYTKYNT